MEEPEQAGVPLEEEEDQNGFFACYLLCSENPRSKGRTYIGFTVNPRRRLRQHNGQLKQGAWLTKKNRPWDMILCVHGFHTQVDALQFEWAWQHPLKSLAVREAAAKIQMKGIRGKVLLLFTMLTCPKWQSMHLNVQFFSTKYTHLRNGCPPLARQMRVSVAPMDDLPCYGSAAPESDEMELSAEEEEEDAAKEQNPVPESPPTPTSEPQVAEPLGMSSQEMMPSEESDLVPCGTRTLQCSSPWLRRHCSAPESPAADPESLPCQKLPLQESNWMAPSDRIHCNNSWQPRQRRKVRKEPAFFCPPSSSEVIVIDASPLPARSDREVIYIEASPLPVCREVIVIEDSPW